LKPRQTRQRIGEFVEQNKLGRLNACVELGG
jgi:hypothetical protein